MKFPIVYILLIASLFGLDRYVPDFNDYLPGLMVLTASLFLLTYLRDRRPPEAPTMPHTDFYEGSLEKLADEINDKYVEPKDPFTPVNPYNGLHEPNGFVKETKKKKGGRPKGSKNKPKVSRYYAETGQHPIQIDRGVHNIPLPKTSRIY